LQRFGAATLGAQELLALRQPRVYLIDLGREGSAPFEL
jgi:hypothetical protein